MPRAIAKNIANVITPTKDSFGVCLEESAITSSIQHMQYLMKFHIGYLLKSFIIAPVSPLKNLITPAFTAGISHNAEPISPIVIICEVLLGRTDINFPAPKPATWNRVDLSRSTPRVKSVSLILIFPSVLFKLLSRDVPPATASFAAKPLQLHVPAAAPSCFSALILYYTNISIVNSSLR